MFIAGIKKLVSFLLLGIVMMSNARCDNGIPPTGKSGFRPEIAVHKAIDGKTVEQ